MINVVEASVARRVSTCLRVAAEFTHSQISETNSPTQDPFECIAKPEFPDGGITVARQNCRVTTAQERHKFVYRVS
jgi:hypothetical protein